MTRTPLFFLVCAFGGAGCFNPDDIFPVEGRVESSQTVEGVRVELRRQRRTTFGPCESLSLFREAQTDTSGGYRFEVFRAAAQELTGMGSFCFQVHTAFASGASATVDVPEISGPLTLPSLVDWRAGFQRDGGVVRFSPMAPLPTGADAALLVHRLSLLTEDGGLAWRQDDLVMDEGSLTPRRVDLADDARILEEFGGALSVESRLIVPGTSPLVVLTEVPPVVMHGFAAGRLSTVRSTLPWSSRTACPGVADPCPLTDRELVPFELDGGEQVRVEFLAPTVPVAVVVRGFVSPATSLVISLIDSAGVEHALAHALPGSLFSGDQERDPQPLPDGGRPYRLRPEPRFAVVPLEVDYLVDAVGVTFPGGVTRLSELSVY